MASMPSITAFAAQVVSGACIRRTIEESRPVAIVVVDHDGMTKASVRMDDVPAERLETAARRARSALMGAGQFGAGSRVLLAGDRVVGAVGVSGPERFSDTVVAEAGAAAMTDLDDSLEMLIDTAAGA